jgi:hypothetical protein
MITRAMFQELCQVRDEGFAQSFREADGDITQRFGALLIWSDWLEEQRQELAAIGAYRMAHGKRWPKLSELALFGWSAMVPSRKIIAPHELRPDLVAMLHVIGCSQSSDLYTVLLAGALVHGEFYVTREAKRAVRLRSLRKEVTG